MRRSRIAALLAVGLLAPAAVALSVRAESAAPDTRGIPAADAAVVRASSGWTRLTRKPEPRLAELGRAHPGAKSIRVNRTRAQLTRGGRQRFPYPVGSVVVKTAASRGAVTQVAIMRKVARGGPRDGGWRFVEYKRSSARDPFARVQVPADVCTGCHLLATEAQGSDWVFTRLAPR